ncbi:MAG TPA: protein kinase [Myxococcota bacterium]|nr:protein kinase [Myxococcota bacterium]
MSRRREGLQPFPVAIGPYTPLRLLGRGGMAGVYLCVNEQGLEVAVKWLDASSPRVRQRFEREGHILEKLRHPGVVRLHDRGTAQGRPYLVMDYVEGQDLRVFVTKLRLRPAPERCRQARRIGIALCEALTAVHEAGVVHRDVKPSNVLVDRSGQVRLSDFGVVKDLEAYDAEATAVGVIIGTAGYCSPEQIRGSDIDHRADLYGLGCTLFYLLTGRRPYPSKERRRVVQAHLHSPVPSPRALDPSIPSAMEATVMRLMAKDRDDRYPSAAAVRVALEATGSHGAPPPLAGRRRYVDAVGRVLDEVREGRPRVIRAVGPSGSGRRWLLEVVEDLARRRGLDFVVARDPATLTAALARVERGETLAVATRLAVGPSFTLERIVLEPMGLADVRRTVVSVAPETPEPHGVAERIYRASGGHPAWLLSVLDAHSEGKVIELPPHIPVPGLVGEAVEDLDFETAEVLGAMAVLEVPASARLLEQVCQFPVDASVEILGEKGLALCQGGLWSVLGEVVGRAARAAIPDEIAVHRRAAAALERMPGEAARARTHRELASDTAEGPRDCDRLLELHLRGSFAEARRDALADLGRARGRREREEELATLRVLGWMLLDQGHARLAEARLADAVALARALERPAERRAAHILRAAATLDARPGAPGSAASALDRVHRALTRVAVTGPELAGWIVYAAAVRARAAASIGDARSWEDALARADDGLRDLGPALRLRTELDLARSCLAAGLEGEAVRRADHCGAEAASRGWHGVAWLASRVRTAATGLALSEPGELAEGLEPREIEALRTRPV